MGSSLKKPCGFFHKFDQNVPTICLSHSLRVLSKHTQQFAQNISGRFTWTYSKETLNLVQPDHELSKNPISIWLSMFWVDGWVYFERTLNEWLRHIVGTFWSNLWKKLLGFFKEEPMGSLMGSFKTYSQLTHWSHQDQIDGCVENLPTIYPLG